MQKHSPVQLDKLHVSTEHRRDLHGALKPSFNGSRTLCFIAFRMNRSRPLWEWPTSGAVGADRETTSCLLPTLYFIIIFSNLLHFNNSSFIVMNMTSYRCFLNVFQKKEMHHLHSQSEGSNSCC